MRDYRDAKIMARTLREALAERNYKITVGESLELIARLFGTADWNSLSARIKNSDQSSEPTPAKRRGGGTTFAFTLEETLHRALDAATERGHAEATLDHLLFSLTYDVDAVAILKACGVAPSTVRELIFPSIGTGTPGEAIGKDPSPSYEFQRVVQRAILDMTASGGGSLTGGHVLAAILLLHDTSAERLLRDRGVDRDKALQVLRQRGV